MSDFFDVFDDKFVSRGFAIRPSKINLKIDYIIAKKSTLELNRRNFDLQVNDFIVNRFDKTVYKIKNITDNKKITVVSNFDVIDFPYFVENAEITSTDLEDTIGTIITDYWTSNIDPQITIPIVVTTPTATSGTLKFFDKENVSLRRIIERAILTFNITVFIEFNGTGLDINIENTVATQLEFNLEHEFINDFNLDVNELTFNKLELISRNEPSTIVEREIYYLLTDNTVSTDENNVNRELPVIFIQRIVPYNDFNLEGAENILQGQLNNNEIQVITTVDSPISELKLGDNVNIHYKNLLIKSIYTGFQTTKNAGQIKYIFGIGRNRLTDKLINMRGE